MIDPGEVNIDFNTVYSAHNALERRHASCD